MRAALVQLTAALLAVAALLFVANTRTHSLSMAIQSLFAPAAASNVAHASR